MEKESGTRKAIVVTAYRPATFYAVFSALIGIAVLLYAFIARDPLVIILIIIPIWMYSYALTRLRPLNDSTIEIDGKWISISLRKHYKVDEVSRGRLSVVHTLTGRGEDVSIEYEPTANTPSYTMREGKLLLEKGKGQGFIGVRVNPTYIVLLLEDAYKIKVNGRTVYLGYLSPASIDLQDSKASASIDIGEEGVASISIKELSTTPLDIYVYSECCGFTSKPVLVGRFADKSIDAKVKLGVPSGDTVMILPDKPYLPSLVGPLLSMLGFPSSYITTHPGSNIVVAIGDREGSYGRIILKPVQATETGSRA